MFTRIVIAIAAFWIVAGCGVSSTIIGERMLTDLNARLPEDERFARQVWHPAKAWDFYSKYWRSGLSRRPIAWQAMLGATALVTGVLLWSWLAAR